MTHVDWAELAKKQSSYGHDYFEEYAEINKFLDTLEQLEFLCATQS